MSPRDTQRSRLYAAERTAFGTAFYGQKIANGDLPAWVTTMMNRRPIRSRWGNRPITVTLKRGGRALGYTSRISLPAWGRNPHVICHEVAHCLTPNGYATHGPEFAGVYLHLVKAVLGAEAHAALRAAFKAHRVRVNSKAIPAVRASVPGPMPVPKPVKAAPKPQRPGKRQVMAIARKQGVEVGEPSGDRWDGWSVEAYSPLGHQFGGGSHYIYGTGDTASQAWYDLWILLTEEPVERCEAGCDCGWEALPA